MLHRPYKLCLFVGICYSATAYAHDQSTWNVAMSTGHGTKHVSTYRVSASKTYGPIWLENTRWPMHFIWENSIARWRSDPGPDISDADALNLITTGPMFRFQKATPMMGLLPYIEGGIGAALLSKTKIGGRTLSTHFQFEDKFGVGFRFGPQHVLDASFRVVHFSNGSIKLPNSGINMYTVSLGFWFPVK